VRQPRGDAAQLRLRALFGRAVGEPSEQLQREMLAALLRRQVRHLRERQPEVGAERKLHPLGHDADNRGRHVVDADRPAEDRRVGAVAQLPDAVAEDRDGRRSRLVVLREEIAAQERPLPDQSEGVGRDVRPLVTLGHAPFVAHVHRRAVERRQPAEALLRLAQVLEIEVRHAHVGAARHVPLRDRHDAIGIVERQAPDEDGVDEGEDRRVHADAEGERDHRDRREPPILDEQARREPQVLKQAHGLYYVRRFASVHSAL
jgi:hypothetical protein